MPAPYTIQQTAEAAGLSVKFIRRLKDALPQLFEKHTERGQANAILFDEEMVEILKRVRSMKNRGQTLKQIREEISGYIEKKYGKTEDSAEKKGEQGTDKPDQTGGKLEQILERENTLLRSQVTLLQDLVRKADERFDRLLPAAGQTEKKSSMKTQLLLWLVEAVVVTVFASGFIFLIWFFAQKAFSA